MEELLFPRGGFRVGALPRQRFSVAGIATDPGWSCPGMAFSSRECRILFRIIPNPTAPGVCVVTDQRRELLEHPPGFCRIFPPVLRD